MRILHNLQILSSLHALHDIPDWYIRAYVHTYIYTYTHRYIHIHMQTHTQAGTHTYTNACTYTCSTNKCTYIQMYTCIHTLHTGQYIDYIAVVHNSYIHTYMHVDTYLTACCTCNPSRKCYPFCPMYVTMIFTWHCIELHYSTIHYIALHLVQLRYVHTHTYMHMLVHA